MNTTSKIFDGIIVLEYRAGSKKAFEILVKKYHTRLCRHACYYTKDIDEAKDVVQDSWGIILRKFHTLKEPNLFGSWAYRIVTRQALNAVKKTTKKTKGNVLEDYISEIDRPEEANELKYASLNKAIASLAENQQIVLRLFYTEDYSLHEISGILGISIGTVKSRLFHAREKLKKTLK